MNPRAAHPGADERGSVLISGLLWTMVVLLLLGAFVDIGRAFIARRELAGLADDAALSASQQLDLNALRTGAVALDPEQARTAAMQVVTTEPDVHGQAQADDTRVEVRATGTISTVLLGLVGKRTLTISATAIAAPRAP
jgi:Flp pilus assembly protein TadG